MKEIEFRDISIPRITHCKFCRLKKDDISTRGYCMDCEHEIKSRKDKIEKLKKNIKQARHNFNRQKNREILKLPTRVLSEFWYLVELNYKTDLSRIINNNYKY